MKTITLAALLSPTLCNALVGITWTAAKTTPSDGLRDITFPINMAQASHVSGYYHAMQFGFNNLGDVGYTGIQPRENVNGKSIVHGVFSSFAAGTLSTHPNCHTGADGGAGTSCAVEIPASYSPTYNFVIENISGTTWRGSMVDTTTGNTTVIGEYILPIIAGGIKPSQLGFVEYYPWNSGSHTCNQLPKTEVTFGIPTTKTSGAGPITLDASYEYGDCVGSVAFKRSRTSAGEVIDVGF